MPESAAFDPVPLAEQLHVAWETRVPVAPLSDAGLRTVEQAYAVQEAWAARRIAAGETVVGRKIGLTSPGMQRQMGVDEPDFGQLWGSRRFDAPGGVATIPCAPFVQPRAEGELAFRLGAPLAGPGITASDVLRAAEAAAPAIEIVDSRIADWRIRLVDTVADNASYGGFACGPWSERLLDADLVRTRLTLARNGRVEVDEPGSAVLGSPLEAVAWLANTLGALGAGIAAGDVVLSGAYGPAVPVVPGDEIVVAVPGTQPLTARMT